MSMCRACSCTDKHGTQETAPECCDDNGVRRGRCLSCPCPAYSSTEGEACVACDHVPAAHEVLYPTGRRMEGYLHLRDRAQGFRLAARNPMLDVSLDPPGSSVASSELLNMIHTARSDDDQLPR
ncbi:uncharacterized protein AMSG_03183 [Thecamonas trahens ATCC 50062]|uniref:Uncharacterized protein n=1 Tax=Thecamonas trahens ATCC 50062 TaxID=461836 RepID=A0A0L0D368_THETB|nr:hypothetical protein AMSG_03183 [Thecamonas trahens ATCC 50062]KNC46754.1 hypothetical protein AMSG_03183 [Thecamonas trahens ATCC 50062]|eukprot:XP_013760034.1 hypothetical protein AMSG_03183 [Thecamonas trahens ATCC 50062]